MGNWVGRSSPAGPTRGSSARPWKPRTSAGACEAHFADRLEDVEVFHSYKPWSRWFYDVAWDSTWLLVDRRFQVVTILAVTDTD